MKSFLNYFVSKMILLNIYVNFAFFLLKYFVLHIIVIPRNETFLYYRTNQISLLHNFAECFSGTRVNQIENKYIVLSFHFVISSSVQSNVTKLLLEKEMDTAGNR